MLSIIISSYQKHYFDQLTENIRETIGEDFRYEIIQIWNPNVMSITEAYNSGAEKARYENLLFLHEDLIFYAQNWGYKLLEHLQKKNSGTVGVAGSSYVPSAPSSWTVAEKYNSVYILQGNKENTEFFHINSTEKIRTEVFAVDGVFMAIKKDNYDKFRFDENLKGFHGYDLDFSLRVARKLQNYVINDILLKHFSGGNPDKKWLDANINIRKKLGSDFKHKIDLEVEKEVFQGFLYNYFRYYPVNRKNILFTLQFYPKKLNFRDHLEILKKYYHYIRYSANINKHTKN
ncbi:glycosyltransferase [Chryseobacterium sp. SL1]|uniref:glycosyltransferase n=1 Tax=Chryseobacterium sp. SL1 TaxID=2995159 RepID=UPI002275245A|nr:glycosyltransferase [Chryseobacterium sp. SL1]MCY1659838.1 glycosyltransferase [Chryseobacterium sp. SL1]